MARSFGHSVLWSRPAPLAEKQLPYHNASTSMVTVGMVFFRSYTAFLFFQTRRLSWCQRAWVWFHMTTAFSLVNFRRACTCFFMSRWNLQTLLNCSVCKFYYVCYSGVFGHCSSHVVLCCFAAFLMILFVSSGKILHEAPDWGGLMVILYLFHFWIIAPAVVIFSLSRWSILSPMSFDKS